MSPKEDIDYKKMWKSNVMLQPKIEKVVINIGMGSLGAVEIQKAQKVLESLTNHKPVVVKAKKNVKEWGLRKNMSVATKVTLRGEDCADFLRKALDPFDNRILKKAFDTKGNFSFGVDEHIKIPGVKYDPELGIFGFNVSVKITRPGLRIKSRKKNRRKVGASQYVSKKEAIFFMENVFKVEIVDKMEERYY